MESLVAAIAGVVAGEMNYLAVVLAAEHRALSEAAAQLPRLVISRHSLTKVLEDWRKGLVSDQDVQKWASFVRRGYVAAGPAGAIRPIPIEYAVEDEDEALIAGIIGRLDEIGDQIDGHIGAHELNEMLTGLGQ